MSRAPIPSSFYVFVIVQHQGRFLAIREAKHGGGWYAPAGRLEHGETIEQAAARETREEAGLDVAPMRILHVDQRWDPGSAWWRFVLTARVRGDDVTPKWWADEHSVEARWVTLEELARLPLRGREVVDLFALAAGVRAPAPPRELRD